VNHQWAVQLKPHSIKFKKLFQNSIYKIVKPDLRSERLLLVTNVRGNEQGRNSLLPKGTNRPTDRAAKKVFNLEAMALHISIKTCWTWKVAIFG
jgi:hypothetical protein